MAEGAVFAVLGLVLPQGVSIAQLSQGVQATSIPCAVASKLHLACDAALNQHS